MPHQLIYYTYVLFDWLGIPRYVGKGKKGRIDSHEKATDSTNWLKNEFIERTWIVLGEIPKIKIREQLSESEAFDLESKLIKIIGRIDQNNGPLTNMSDGGEGSSGRKNTPETIERMRIAALKTSIKRSNDMKKWRTGKKLTIEQKQRLREISTGKTYSDEVNAKKGRKGIKFTDEHRKNISKARIGKPTGRKTLGMTGKHHTEATKNKMSLIRKGRPKSNNTTFAGRRHTAESKLKISKTKADRRAKLQSVPIRPAR